MTSWSVASVHHKRDTKNLYKKPQLKSRGGEKPWGNNRTQMWHLPKNKLWTKNSTGNEVITLPGTKGKDIFPLYSHPRDIQHALLFNCPTGVNWKQDTKPRTHSQCRVQQKGTVGERTRKGCRLEYSAAIWPERGDDQSEPESVKWESVSHTAFTTVPPPGPETKPVEPMGRHRDQNTCKLTLVFEGRKKKGGKRRKQCRWDMGQIIWAGYNFLWKKALVCFRVQLRNALSLPSFLCSH